MFKFKVNHYYHCGNLEKLGFEAVVDCVERINHRDGTVSLRFFITDLKINDFNTSASEFVYRIKSANQITIWPDCDGTECVDGYYFMICAEREVPNKKLQK